MPSFEQRLAQTAQVHLLPDHHRHDGRLAVQHRETARAQLLAQQRAAICSRCWRRSGSLRMICSAAPTAATDAAGRLAENTNGRAVCFR